METYDFCVENDYVYWYLSFSGYERAKKLMDGYWRRVEELGADKSPYRAGFAQTVCVADTDADAERLWKDHVSYFYNRCLHLHPGFTDAPGYRTVKTIQSSALSQYTSAGIQEARDMSWKELVDQRYVVAGSPESVRQQLEELVDHLQVGNLALLMHVGDAKKDLVMHSSKLFAQEVMPHLRNLHPDWEQEDRFWCQPLRQEERAQPASC